MSSSNHMVILGADLTTPEQIQAIAGLASPPERVHVSKVIDDEEDQEEEGYEEDEEAEEGETGWGCWIDVATRTALMKWATKERKAMKSIFHVKRPAATVNAIHTYPVPYFFYGTLADPAILGGKLGINEVSNLKKGTI